jgi:hypothetical protein
VQELARYSLSPNESFFTSEWNDEFGESEELNASTKTPRKNVKVLFNRAMAVICYLEDVFDRVSKPYFGKTVNLRSKIPPPRRKITR